MRFISIDDAQDDTSLERSAKINQSDFSKLKLITDNELTTHQLLN